MTGPMDSNEMLFRTWYPGGENNSRAGNDDNRGNVATPAGNVDGNRVSSPEGNRDPADGNRVPGNRKRPARNAKKRGPHRPQPGAGGNEAPASTRPESPAPAAEGDGRSRRSPFGRVRKRGKREDGGSDNAPGNSE